MSRLNDVHEKTNFPGICWAIGAVVAGQLLISFGQSLLGGYHLVIGVSLAIAGSVMLLCSSKVEFNDYWTNLDAEKMTRSWPLTVIVISVLLLSSWLNYKTDQIGFAEDEFLEFVSLGLQVFQDGWLWWANVDNVFTWNITGLLCRIMPLKFETIKFSAFIFRTGAGIALWLLAKELFGRRIGNLCGLIVATSVVYLCSFNTVIKDISSHVIFLATLLLIFMGSRRKSKLLLFIAGMSLGLSYYTYVSFLAFFGAIIIWAVISSSVSHGQAELKSRITMIIYGFAGFIILLVPALIYFLKYPYPSSHLHFLNDAAVSQSSWHAGGLRLVVKSFWLELLAVVYQGNHYFTNNFNNRPMLCWPLACGFWVGFIMMLRHLKESRVFVIFLVSAALLGLACLNVVHTPNWKISRTAMLLSVIPCAVGIDFISGLLAKRLKIQSVRWMPWAIVGLTSWFGLSGLNQVMTHPASWWFRAANTMKTREDFVYANSQCRFWELGAPVTDVTSNSIVKPIFSVRQVLETPNDGYDVIFMFPCGRQEWTAKVNQLVGVWRGIYPGGNLQVYAVPVTGGQWPAFISYHVPAQQYWSLPKVNGYRDSMSKAETFWKRTQLLHQHGLVLEAWRDALNAAHLDDKYYPLADTLLGNVKGLDGRLSVLIKGRLWNDAREELEYWQSRAQLSAGQVVWRNFLEYHGLQIKAYDNYIGAGAPIAQWREYMSQMFMGIKSFASSHHMNNCFIWRAEGQIYIPRDGTYRFDTSLGDNAQRNIFIDDKKILDVSVASFHHPELSERIYLKTGLHKLVAQNSTFIRFSGVHATPAGVPDVLGYLYGFDIAWFIKWQYEDGPVSFVDPEYLYSSSASNVCVIGQLLPP